MQVNVVKILEDSDFSYVKKLCTLHDDWQIVYEKKHSKIWKKAVPNSDILMIKAMTTYSDVPASVAYDVLHDPAYRSTWDKYMITTTDIGILNPNNDICYYALGAIPPFRNRDFVMQRSWLDKGNEKYICGHSVCHEDYPPFKGFIRGTIHLTAYYVQAVTETSCDVIYVTQSDPKGKLPSWLINKVTKVVAPRALKKLHKACLNYPEWKKGNNPNWMPWHDPGQLENAPKIDIQKCQARQYDVQSVDETSISSKDAVEIDQEDE